MSSKIATKKWRQKNSEYGGALIVERKDIDRLRRNKDNNGCMIEPALTKNTNEYTYNHFKNVNKRGRQIRGALKPTSRDKVQRVKGIKSLMLFTTVKVDRVNFNSYFKILL